MSFSLRLVNGGAVFAGLDFSHGGTVELQLVCVVNDAIEDGVGEGGFADDIVEAFDVVLTPIVPALNIDESRFRGAGQRDVTIDIRTVFRYALS